MTNANSVESSHQGPIVIVGGSGMLGRQYQAMLAANHDEFVAPTTKELNIRHRDDIEQVVTPDTNLVINCAAFTDVDSCEKPEFYQLAKQVNGYGAGRIAERCRKVDALLVHYSTDYVFDGQALKPYSVDALVSPVNAYGRSKALGERLIRESGCRHLIIRTSWLYAPHGRNFVRTVAKLVSEKSTLHVVYDQQGCPTSAEHLVKTSLALVNSGSLGTQHITDGGHCTWFEFAAKIVELLDSDCDVRPCTTNASPKSAPRPAFSVLNTSKTEIIVGPLPGWKHNLARVLNHLKRVKP